MGSLLKGDNVLLIPWCLYNSSSTITMLIRFYVMLLPKYIMHPWVMRMLMSSLCRLQFHEWSCCQLCSYLNSSVTFVQHSWILSSHLITLSVLLTLNQLYLRNQPYVETVYGIPSNNHLWTCQATMLETLPWESISCYVAASALAETPLWLDPLPLP